MCQLADGRRLAGAIHAHNEQYGRRSCEGKLTHACTARGSEERDHLCFEGGTYVGRRAHAAGLELLAKAIHDGECSLWSEIGGLRGVDTQGNSVIQGTAEQCLVDGASTTCKGRRSRVQPVPLPSSWQRHRWQILLLPQLVVDAQLVPLPALQE